ncbi:hypothetical protein M427DRAFT_153632 [Gonapodya prolifera JEL478]|uniref:Uncharacterized protein n=1 Tax=Gonapodya prolifera (strain JEL478) TaxID=1344416 RepID=A0A139ALV1_GONPJ|nr:hypothetical protein M427DRAFT_153632 [Gonapodya prolifera JEL478]|eukprot:KXS17739.1 hypothetical protein M427DRAFT_153632 [Gonapodya prolifera JEL478]
MRESKNARQAYFGSLRDSKRQWITTEELCSFTWNFRMKDASGSHFTDLDPWWNYEPARTRLYNPDGTMGGTVYRPDARWRFVPTGGGIVAPHEGCFMRIGNTPAQFISRHSNWGFMMQSCWSVSTSFLMPMRGTDPSLDDSALSVTTETQKYEVICYNSGIDYPDDCVMTKSGFRRVLQTLGTQGNAGIGWLGLLFGARFGWPESDSEPEDSSSPQGQGQGQGPQPGSAEVGGPEMDVEVAVGVEDGVQESSESSGDGIVPETGVPSDDSDEDSSSTNSGHDRGVHLNGEHNDDGGTVTSSRQRNSRRHGRDSSETVPLLAMLRAAARAHEAADEEETADSGVH